MIYKLLNIKILLYDNTVYSYIAGKFDYDILSHSLNLYPFAIKEMLYNSNFTITVFHYQTFPQNDVAITTIMSVLHSTIILVGCS